MSSFTSTFQGGMASRAARIPFCNVSLALPLVVLKWDFYQESNSDRDLSLDPGQGFTG